MPYIPRTHCSRLVFPFSNGLVYKGFCGFSCTTLHQLKSNLPWLISHVYGLTRFLVQLPPVDQLLPDIVQMRCLMADVQFMVYGG
ncbi:hypothetical protein BofuT4_uP148180.1 [Botrytis cinerea T4]|uniref:Uncharacterized protein n=1 Tax=Botryotinia fuckeliana (strain T4) TaxID=999810 RepID=G2YWX0_BOTF4|nr:hypothetical protein BofuT4_uP148180.1 [Botrytis cinerea T4]